MDTAADDGIGRWRTLKDASRLLHRAPDDLLKDLKRGRVRGTQIGNNWFAYIDADMEAAAAERARQRAAKQDLRKKTVNRLRAENEELRAALKRNKQAAAQAFESATPSPEPVDKPVDAAASGSELAFLREELREMRRQHAEEMRRKDILLRQSHQFLQDVVKSGLLEGKTRAAPLQVEFDQLRQQHQRTLTVLGEMTSVLGVMYRRLRDNRSGN